MTKVVISGYYGFHNSGDEAILYAMLMALGEAVPGLEVTVFSKDPAYTAREFNVCSISRDNPLLVFNTIKQSDLLISGGGGLLQDITGPKSIIYYLGVVAMARLLGKPVFFYAQGIGPINTALGKALTGLIANHVNAITVRDPDSRDELKALGVTRPELTVTADPVLGLAPSVIDVKKGRKILSLLGVDGRPVVGVSVRPWKGLEGYKRAIAKVADDLAGEGWQVLLIPMHSPGDLETCREVAALMGGRAILFDRHTDYMSLLAVTAGLDLAIGMRLHFLIFSVLSGVPVVGVPYDPKVNSFLQSAGLYLGLSAERLEYGELSTRVKQIAGNRQKISAGLKERTSVLRKEALKNASLVAELLRSQ